jgi:rod shape determining protein RodA
MAQTIKDFDILDVRVGIFNHRNLKHIDWVLAGLVVVLALIGFAVLFSAGRGVSAPTPYYAKQALFFVVGVGIALFIMCIDSRFLVWIAPVMYACAVLMLLAVILFGTSVKGGQRWLPVGPFRLQPSEQTKIVVVYMLAWYLSLVKERIQKLHFLVLAFVIAGIPAALILKQPSLGTAMALIPLSFVMVCVAGCKWWHLGFIALAGTAAIPAAYHKLEDYQKSRLTSFINTDAVSKDDGLQSISQRLLGEELPKVDPQGSGWQTRQSKITVGSGGLSGKGFGRGTQTLLNYLPEHHTDFIFSLLAEEHGFIGATIVIGLFAAFLLRGLSLALKCTDFSNALLATGCVTILGFHVFVNIAITIGLMPVTGIPLPFLSYGGNFYMTTMMCVGVLLHVPVRKLLFD